MIANSSTRTLGIDLGDRKHSVCVLGADGKILDESTVANTRETEFLICRPLRRRAA